MEHESGHILHMEHGDKREVGIDPHVNTVKIYDEQYAGTPEINQP